ncbi:MAG TPA: SPFH domain-containing protein [Chthonomonadaceae bacterium]|nr:SPFH domain-containing protein [Chthonomonadaceae bacterium]
MHPLILLAITIVSVVGVLPLIIRSFLRSVEAGEIRLVRGMDGALKIYRGPCKAMVVPLLTVTSVVPAQAINVDIEITDQTADLDVNARPAPIKVTVKASVIVSVGENDDMVNTAANRFFSKPPEEQLTTLTDLLSSAGRRAVNLLRHDQLFNARSTPTPRSMALTAPGTLGLGVPAVQTNDDELAVIIKEACSRELLDLGLSFNSLNIKAVVSEVANAQRRESGARAKASADVVQAQEAQRARIAQLEAMQKINDQERALRVQMASNGASVAHAEAEKQVAVRGQREAELAASQITQARADAERNIIQQRAEGEAQAARILLIAGAEAHAIRQKSQALIEAGQGYFDLRRLELAPALTHEVAKALSHGLCVNFGARGSNGQSATGSGSNDVLRVVQTLMAARIITRNNGRGNPPAHNASELPQIS